jgi:ribosome-binding factor A
MAYQRPHSPKSIKAAQLADLIRDLIASYIQKEVHGSIITVSSVTMNPDLQRATAWVRVFPSENSHQMLKQLRNSLGKYQTLLKNDLARKNMPKLYLELDTTLEDENHINSLLNQ